MLHNIRHTCHLIQSPLDRVSPASQFEWLNVRLLQTSEIQLSTKTVTIMLLTFSKEQQSTSSTCPITSIFTSDSVYATPNPSVCHTCDLYQNGWTYHGILSLSDRPVILVCYYQGLLRKSDGFTPNGGTKYKGGGVAIFDEYAAISQKW